MRMANYFRRRKNLPKYGNEKVTSLCSYGFSHRSKLERALCDQIAFEEKAGVLAHLAHEDTVYLTKARYRYVPDFRVQDTKTGEIFWREAKGGSGNDRWPTTKKLWKHYGPGRLEVWGGTHRRLMLSQTIVPVERDE
jgi:hypothetical protein